MKVALKVEGNGTHLKTSIHLSAASLLEPWERESSMSHQPMTGAGVLQSSLLRAPVIYKQTFVLQQLWCLLFIYIPILTEKEDSDCSGVHRFAESHRFPFVYWGVLCYLRMLKKKKLAI